MTLHRGPGKNELVDANLCAKGNVAHFAVCKNHIGFYPGDGAVEAFREEMEQYKGTKGSLHFPMDQPLPLELIEKMVKFSVGENKQSADKRECNWWEKLYSLVLG